MKMKAKRFTTLVLVVFLSVNLIAFVQQNYVAVATPSECTIKWIDDTHFYMYNGRLNLTFQNITAWDGFALTDILVDGTKIAGSTGIMFQIVNKQGRTFNMTILSNTTSLAKIQFDWKGTDSGTPLTEWQLYINFSLEPDKPYYKVEAQATPLNSTPQNGLAMVFALNGLLDKLFSWDGNWGGVPVLMDFFVRTTSTNKYVGGMFYNDTADDYYYYNYTQCEVWDTYIKFQHRQDIIPAQGETVYFGGYVVVADTMAELLSIHDELHNFNIEEANALDIPRTYAQARDLAVNWLMSNGIWLEDPTSTYETPLGCWSSDSQYFHVGFDNVFGCMGIELMLMLYDETGDVTYLKKAEAVGNVITTFHQNKTEGSPYYGMIWDMVTKTDVSWDARDQQNRDTLWVTDGAEAVYQLLKLYNYVPKQDYLDCAKRFADAVLSQQQANGTIPLAYSITDGNQWIWNLYLGYTYYPSAAITQMVKVLVPLYQITGNTTYLEKAELMMNYWLSQYENDPMKWRYFLYDAAGQVDPPAEGSILQALAKLYTATGNQTYKDKLETFAYYMMFTQNSYHTPSGKQRVIGGTTLGQTTFFADSAQLYKGIWDAYDILQIPRLLTAITYHYRWAIHSGQLASGGTIGGFQTNVENRFPADYPPTGAAETICWGAASMVIGIMKLIELETFTNMSLRDYNRNLKANQKPWITRSNATITALTWDSYALTFTANASGTSITTVNTMAKGEPLTVTGATSWTYNSTTKILTVTVEHASPATVEIRWGYPPEPSYPPTPSPKPTPTPTPTPAPTPTIIDTIVAYFRQRPLLALLFAVLGIVAVYALRKRRR
jgi:hypothetical protein